MWVIKEEKLIQFLYSRYVEIRRSTTPGSANKETEDVEDDQNSKYKTIRRGTTTSTPELDELYVLH